MVDGPISTPVPQSPSVSTQHLEPSAVAATAVTATSTTAISATSKTTEESSQHIEPAPAPPQRLPAIQEIQDEMSTAAPPAQPLPSNEASAGAAEIARLEEAKLAAAEIEDFATAAALKKQVRR